MSTVRIVHPDAGEAEVPESAVPAWRSSGWEVAPEPEKPPVPPKAEEQDSKPSGRPRRRSSEESE